MAITDGSGDDQLPGICEMLANLLLDNDPIADVLANQLALLLSKIMTVCSSFWTRWKRTTIYGSLKREEDQRSIRR